MLYEFVRLSESAIGSMLIHVISLFRVISWFDTVCIIVTRWVNFEKKTQFHEHEPQLSDYNIFAQMYKVLVEKYIFTIFLMNFSRSNWKI